ncbi:D-lactate dehydrogenase (quinone) [Ewingella americana]
MNTPLINQLKDVVGHSHVLTKTNDKVPYTKGFRVGKGEALAVALPSSLMEMWQLLKVCVAHDVIILMQASNTGVTGGSTPDGNDYDREIVIISTRKINGLHLLDDANQVLAFPGTTLTELENALKPFHREPHSVIGSSCIGASVIGGICNNSGGSLIRRGPAFTEKSLYAAIDEQGQLQLINHLGIELGETPEEILGNLVSKHYTTGDAADWQGRIWADDYEKKLRDVDSDQPTRYNGNPEYLHESAGSSGKLAVFSVRLPTFESSRGTTTFYIGANDETELVELRRFLLKNLQASPLQAEYIHRQAFDLTIRYAKHVYKAISKQGAAKIPEMFAQKNQIDKIVRAIPILPNHAFDSLIQIYNRFTPDGVEPRIMDFHHQFEHHLMLKTEQKDAPELKTLLQNFFASRQGKFFECSSAEEKNAFFDSLRRRGLYGLLLRRQGAGHQPAAGGVRRGFALQRPGMAAEITGPFTAAGAARVVLRPLLLLCKPSGLHPEARLRSDGLQTRRAGIYRNARREIPGRAQCRPSVPRLAGLRAAYAPPRPNQQLQRRGGQNQ